MSNWSKALILALAIPIVALVVITAADAGLEREWREALEAEFGPIPAESADELRVAALCGDPLFVADFPEACNDSRLAAGGRVAVVIGIALAIVLLVFIRVTSLTTQRDRSALARIFRPGLYLVLLALTVLMVVDGGLVMVATYLGEASLLGYIHPGIILGVGVAVLVATYGVLQAVVTMARRHPLDVDAILLSPEADRGLSELVADGARRIGTSPPDQIVVGLEPNFFVTEEDVRTRGGIHRGRTLYVSIAACRVLNRTELLAVIGHELGHFEGEDTQYSRRFFPIYRGATRSLGVLQAAAGGLAIVPLAAPLLILGSFFESFAIAERRISRDRELAADAIGADLTSPETAASALVKLHAIVPDWTDVASSALIAIRDGSPVGNVSARFADRVALGARIGHLSQLLEERTSHPIDSHPRLDTRLEALGVPMDSIAGEAAKLAPAEPAIRLLGEVEPIELELSRIFAEHFSTAVGGTTLSEPEFTAERTRDLTEAAQQDPVIERSVAVFANVRGPALTRPFQPDVGWVNLVDLEFAMHPDPLPFLPLAEDDELPGGDQRLIVRVADAMTPPYRRVSAGTWFRPIGINERAWRMAGLSEDTYAVGDIVMAVRGVGDWPVEHQLAGLFVVPKSDPLAGDDSAFATDIAELAAAFGTRQRPATSDDDDEDAASNES